MARVGHHPGKHNLGHEEELKDWPLTQKKLQSLGWEHYEVHEPEPHILLFK